MAKIPAKAIEEYQRALQRDPNSKIFAPLAEALRENGEFKKAENVAMDGVQRHPQYVGGYVTLGRVLMDQTRMKEALPIVQKATELDPENLLALHLLGTVHIQLNQPKEALKAFKRVLFLNPQSEKAKNAVQKLENISADEYEDDVFQYQTLKQGPGLNSISNESESLQEPISSPTPQRPSARPQAQNQQGALTANEINRKLSLVDAFIIRNDLERARQVLMEIHAKDPHHPEIARRFELLEESVPEEVAAPLHPLRSREQQVVQRKRQILETLLQRIKEHHESSIFDSSST